MAIGVIVERLAAWCNEKLLPLSKVSLMIHKGKCRGRGQDRKDRRILYKRYGELVLIPTTR